MVQDSSPTLHNLGEDGLLVEFGASLTMEANAAAIAFRCALEGLRLRGVTEVGSTLKSTFICFDPVALPHTQIIPRIKELMADRDWHKAPLPEARHWELPSCFDGSFAPQLAEFSKLSGISESDLIAQLSATPLRVLALGFAPGMPYLGQLPEGWNVPRQTSLTPQVPVGAITAAIRQIVLFAVPSSTGWRQIGQAAWRGWDASGGPEQFMTAGDTLRFAPCDEGAFRAHLAAGGHLVERSAP